MKRLEALYNQAKSRVIVACDENHRHTASKECFVGDERDIAVCMAYEEVTRLFQTKEGELPQIPQIPHTELSKTEEPEIESVLEKPRANKALAAHAHESWSNWMRYLFSKLENGVLIPPECATQWKQQMDTPYVELSEKGWGARRMMADAEAIKIMKIFIGEDEDQ